jgi:tetratricopeptide (TPR) repeat protein/serine/threonine protein kinase
LKALELPSAERQAFLDCACGGDAALRAEVESLLQANTCAGSFLESPVPAPDLLATVDEPSPVERVGTAIGPYKLREELGEGGFGIVFLAEQTQPVRRKVALKVLKAGMDTRQVVARFEAERQALAIMDHPNIAKVFDGGATASGRPYFVMELVKGTSITAFCDQNHLSIRERLELFASVCAAVQHAHQKGIIHRDLKPSNVLVAVHDKPVVKVIDFGVAKALGQELTEKTLFTGFAQMIGTPLYMSPEQAGMSGLDVDTRSDIYSLGVLLYELLTGTTPFDKERLKQADCDEMRRIIREEEPPRPSTRISTMGQAAPTASANRKSDPRRLSQLCRGELDWVVMKALEKDRNRRYETANAFAGDVQRYLHDEPVQACPPSAWYRFRKFSRRNKGVLTTATALVLVALMLAGGAGWMLQERAGRRARTIEAAEAALEASYKLQGQGRAPEALEAGRRAEAALATGEASPGLHRRVRERLRDLEMWTKVESVRLRKGQVREVWFSSVQLGTWEALGRGRAGKLSPVHADMRVDEELTRAFEEYGVRVEELEAEEAGRQIRDRGIAVELAAALHDWALWRQGTRPRGDATWKHLLAVARAADPDEWRTRLRDAVEKYDRRALEKLADEDAALSLPVLSQVLLADALGHVRAQDKAVAFLRKAQRQHPGELWLNLYLANSLHWRAQKRRPGEAIPFYAAALAARPRNAGLQANLASALLHSGDLDEAIAAYKKAIDLDPDFFLAHLGLADALDEKGRYDEAVTACQQASRIRPRDIAPYNALGIILAKQRKFDEAVAALKRAISLRRDDDTAHFNLGMVLRQKKAPTEAVAAFQEALRLRPRDFPTLMGLAEALHEKGSRAEAQDVYRQAFDCRPRHARVLLDLGATLRNRGLRDEAITAFREAVGIAPSLAEAHASLGDEYRAKDQFDRAAVAYREAIRLRPGYAMAHHALGLVLTAQRSFDDAIFHYREAIRLQPRMASAYLSLGIVLCDQKRNYKGAVAAFKEAVRLDENNAVAHNNLGIALLGKRDHDGAIVAFRKAIRLTPGNALLHFKLGDAFAARHNHEDAIRAYRAAIRLKPDLFEAHFRLGKTLVDRDAPRDAIEPLQKAAELRPDHAWAHAYLGDALQEAGRPDEAMKAYGKALELRRKLVADFPRAPAYRSELGATLNNLALLLLKRKSPARSIPLLEEAVRHQKAALKLGPEAPHYRAFLRNHYWNLAEAHLRIGQHGKAAQAAAELPDLYPDGWQEPVRAAGYLARCAALAAKDTTLPEDRRKELVEANGHRAVALLRRATDRGWNDRSALKAPVFEPLRSRDDFQKLRAALGMKSEP